MPESLERINRIKQLDEGEMMPVAEKLARNEDVTPEELQEYKQKYEKLVLEPVLKSELGNSAQETFSPEELADAAKILGEEQGIDIPEGKLTELEELVFSAFKVKANANNMMPSDKAIEKERARIIKERAVESNSRGEKLGATDPEPEADENETAGVIDGEVRDLRWDENLDGDLRVASREPRRWKDSKDHSKGELSEDQKTEDVRKISSARDRLNSRGYNTDLLQDRLGRRQVANARRVIVEGADEAEVGMAVEDAEKIFDQMNVDSGKAREEGEKRRASTGSRTETPDSNAGESGEKKAKKKTFNVNSPEELEQAFEKINKISDLSERANRYRQLARQMYDEDKEDWGNLASLKRTELTKNEKTASIGEIRDLGTDLVKWRKWARARMSALLDPELRRTGKNPGNIFGVTADTAFGKQNADGSLYMPSVISDEVHGEFRSDGRVEKLGEITAANEVGAIYSKWKETHKSLSSLVNAFDPQRSAEYSLPGNDLNKFLLNDFVSENGVEGGGSKNVAKALRIYWAMAHGNDEEGQNILYNEGLEDLPNLFNTSLSVEAKNAIRDRIAEKCGGIFYENIGLMYAGFFGVTAYGSNSTAPAIEHVDMMGRLIHTEVNHYKDEDERTNPGKRAARYMDDLIANALMVYGEEKILVKSTSAGNQYVPVEIGVHPGNFQESIKDKYFYFGTDPEGSLVCKKKLAEGMVDSGESLDSLIKTGRVNLVDWGKSDDLLAIFKYRESLALNVYKLYKNLDDDLAKLTIPELVSKRELFDNALPQYSVKTRQNSAFLWMYSLIAKNRLLWTKEDKRLDLKNMVDESVKVKLISQSEAVALDNVFNIGVTKAVLQEFKDQKYRPDNLVKEVLGLFGVKK